MNSSVSINERVFGRMESNCSRFDATKSILVEHLENLITEFDPYIPDRNLFLTKVDNLSEDVAGLQEELINLHHDEF